MKKTNEELREMTKEELEEHITNVMYSDPLDFVTDSKYIDGCRELLKSK